MSNKLDDFGWLVRPRVRRRNFAQLINKCLALALPVALLTGAAGRDSPPRRRSVATFRDRLAFRVESVMMNCIIISGTAIMDFRQSRPDDERRRQARSRGMHGAVMPAAAP